VAAVRQAVVEAEDATTARDAGAEDETTARDAGAKRIRARR
jgi:hypothetical protein